MSRSCLSSGSNIGLALLTFKLEEGCRPSGDLTRVAQKPSLVIEQATSPYSFRSSELSQPI